MKTDYQVESQGLPDLLELERHCELLLWLLGLQA